MITLQRLNFQIYPNLAPNLISKNAVKHGIGFGSNYSNALAPLQRDTVTFTRRDEKKPKSEGFADNSKKNMDFRAHALRTEMKPFAQWLHSEALRHKDDFDITTSIFDCLLHEGGTKRQGGVLETKRTRIKSVQSITEKLAKRASTLQEGNEGYPVVMTKAMVKDTVHDTYGVQLILKNGTYSEGNAVINRLIKSLNTGHGPKIKYIKSYGKGDSYIDKRKLNELESAVVNAGYEPPRLLAQEKSSGYTATHIIFEVRNGIDAEIQILGRGVHRVKEVEDVCYKGLQGKSIKGHPELSKLLKKVDKDPRLKFAFNDYLTSAYKLAKTEWDRMPEEELKKQKFPPIDPSKFPKACALSEKDFEYLDLNNIEEAINSKSLS